METKTNLQKFLDLGGSIDVEFIQKTRMYSGTEDFGTGKVKELSDLLDYDHAYADDSDCADDKYSIYDPNGKLIGEGKTRKETQELIDEYVDQY